MINIDGEVVGSVSDSGIPVLRSGFRPFFLAAACFAVISMFIWLVNFVFSVEFSPAVMSANLWHAHEMLFGYVMAVIAGFLLTAIKNWTGLEVLRGKPLAGLFMLWLLARTLPLSGISIPLWLMATVDVSFLFILAVVCLRPVLKVRQYKQAGIISKLFLMMLSHLVFYLGLAGVIDEGVRWGMYSALYMIIALILVMLRRVMPMFISNGIDGEFEAVNRAWLDHSSLVLLLALWLFDVFSPYKTAAGVVAAILVVLHSIRLAGWYTGRIWSKPLVWVLVLAYVGLISGFALKAVSAFTAISPYLSVHAFTVGGIGMVTLGMMSRVALGHTGRDVFDPPAVLFWSFLFLALGFVARVILPIISIELYVYWIAIAQILWILAFGLFVVFYTPMLLAARVDGRDG